MFDVDKLFLATKAYVNGEYELFSEDNPTKGGLTNKLLESYLTLLCDAKNYSESRASIDTFTKILKDRLINAEGVLRDPQDLYIPSFTELMPFFQMNRKLEFSVGKEGIAPFALNVTNLALTQYCHLTMRYEGVIKDYDFGDLDAIDGKDGRRISGWLSAMVNAHVDVAKDPYIFDLNVNHATYNYANFLIRAGKGLSTFTFLSQQSLKNIAARINNSGGMYGGNPVGDNPTEEILNVSKNNAIREEYKALRDRLKSLRKDYENSKDKKLTPELAVKLDHLIDFLDYELLSLKLKRKFRDSDKEIPSLEFDRKLVFDEEYAIKLIKNKRSSNLADILDHLEFQLACIRAFLELSPHAQAISELVSASLIDTKKFGNTIRDHINFDNKVQHLLQDSSIWTINKEGFDDQFKDEKGRVDHKKASREALRIYFEDSYLQHKFESATSNVREILKTQLVTATDDYDLAFKAVMKRLNGGVALYDKEFSQEKIDAIGTALDNLFRFNIMFNVGKDMKYLNENAIDFTLGGNKLAVINKMRDLLYGSDNVKPLYKRLYEFKRALKSADAMTKYPDLVDDNGQYHNDLLDALIPVSPTKNVEIGRINIRLQSRDTTTDQKSRLVSSFAQLLDSANKDVAELARDLVFYAYYSNYDQDVRNSFFDLVPPPYREQYDWALSSTLYHLAFSTGADRKVFQDAMFGDLATIDSNTKTNAINVDGMLDVICRNYWYDNNIVSRYYPERPQSDFNFGGFLSYGPERMSQGEFGFPGYVCMLENYKIKGNPYFKITIKGKTVLYRKVGEIEKEYATGKQAGTTLSDTISIYAPVPKAGYRSGDVQQFEFYAGFETPSLFEGNKLSTNLSMEKVRSGVQKIVDDYHKIAIGELKEDRKFNLKINWDTEEIPEVYDILNTDVYKKYDDSVEPKHGNVSIVQYGQGKNAWFTLNNKANVIINLVTSDDTKAPNTPEKAADKVVTININKPISKDNVAKIKDLLQEGYKWAYITSSGNIDVSITKQDIEEYLLSFGELSEREKAYYRKHSDKLAREIKQFKAAKVLTDLLRSTEESGIILHSLFDKFGDTYTTKVMQIAASNLKGVVKNANVHVDAVNYVGKRGMGKRLHYALDSFVDSNFVQLDVEQLADDLAKLIANQTSTKRAEKLIEESKQGSKDIDSNEPKAPEVESITLKESSEDSKDNAENKKCAGSEGSSDKPKKKSMFSVSEDMDDTL